MKPIHDLHIQAHMCTCTRTHSFRQRCAASSLLSTYFLTFFFPFFFHSFKWRLCVPVQETEQHPEVLGRPGENSLPLKFLELNLWFKETADKESVIYDLVSVNIIERPPAKKHCCPFRLYILFIIYYEFDLYPFIPFIPK